MESSQLDSAAPRDLTVNVDLRRGRLRRNLLDALRSAIQQGTLHPGTILPSSRSLAGALGVSRGVVSDVYDELELAGYVRIDTRRAPRVAPISLSEPPEPETTHVAWRFDLVATTPDVELFPWRLWLRAVERVAARRPAAALDYGDHRGRIELRDALATYLGRARGVQTAPHRIVITQGFTQGLDLLCRVLAARSHRTIAFESPSLPDGWETARRAGMNVVFCPVDGDGVNVDQLWRLGASAVVVTPAHQFPTGAVMSSSRRVALLRWAESTNGLIIEDDYDAEFRYDRKPVGAVQGLDPPHVVHAGTASKTLAPGVRLGWLSLPVSLVDDVRAMKRAADSGSPVLDQLALAELLSSGDYDRAVGRARRHYRRRRDRLVAALTAALPEFQLRGAAAGLHLVLALPKHVDDVAIAAAAAGLGIHLRPLSPMAMAGVRQRGLLIGYGRIADEDLSRVVHALADLVSVESRDQPTAVRRNAWSGRSSLDRPR